MVALGSSEGTYSAEALSANTEYEFRIGVTDFAGETDYVAISSLTTWPGKKIIGMNKTNFLN